MSILQLCSQVVQDQSKGLTPLGTLPCCRDNQGFAKVYEAVRTAEQEFNLNLPTLAYLAVLRTCSTDGSVRAARFALRIVEGLKVRAPPISLATLPSGTSALLHSNALRPHPTDAAACTAERQAGRSAQACTCHAVISFSPIHSVCRDAVPKMQGQHTRAWLLLVQTSYVAAGRKGLNLAAMACKNAADKEPALLDDAVRCVLLGCP